MNWRISHRADTPARLIADRHYNRQKPGALQFVPPGRCLVLISSDKRALWVSSWPLPQYVKHSWAGAWINSAFRREGGELASTLIREAVAVTRWYWPEVPKLGMVSFIDAGQVRHKRDPGRCYIRAGFKYVKNKSGKCILTKGGLVVVRMPPWRMPAPREPLPYLGELFWQREAQELSRP